MHVNSFFGCPEFSQPTAFFNIVNLLISCLHAPALPSKSVRSKVARRRPRVGLKIRRSVTQRTPFSTATRMDRCFADVYFIRFLDSLKETDRLHRAFRIIHPVSTTENFRSHGQDRRGFPGNLVFIISGHTFLPVEICRRYLHHIAEDSFIFYNSVSMRSTLCCRTKLGGRKHSNIPRRFR